MWGLYSQHCIISFKWSKTKQVKLQKHVSIFRLDVHIIGQGGDPELKFQVKTL